MEEIDTILIDIKISSIVCKIRVREGGWESI
jgi:hypothetical protein